MTVPQPLDEVRAQYEALPYPPRDPRDEAVRLITGTPSHILEVNHYLFSGRLNFNRPFRALVAGGGTGDACIMLAQQMVDRRCPGEVVYLDLSTASRAICEARAKARGLRNINFLTGSLLDLPTMPIGQFDYIDCTGVLHHLPDPAAGMRALASVLNPDGGMGVMLYGEYGRSGVYPLQELLRTLAPPSMALEDRIAMTKRLIRFLPTTNLFRRNPYLNDHVTGGDAGLYDLLLHSIDRAYTVPEISDMAASAGLRVVAFLEPVRYEPATYMSDPIIARQASSVGRAVFHLDGPDAARHVKALLSVPAIDAIQFTPGAANPSAIPWIDMFRTIQSAGRSVLVVEIKTGASREIHQRQLDVYVAAARALFPGATVEGRLVYS